MTNEEVFLACLLVAANFFKGHTRNAAFEKVKANVSDYCLQMYSIEKLHQVLP